MSAIMKSIAAAASTILGVVGLAALCVVAVAIGAAMVSLAMLPFATMAVWLAAGLKYLQWWPW